MPMTLSAVGKRSKLLAEGNALSKAMGYSSAELWKVDISREVNVEEEERGVDEEAEDADEGEVSDVDL